MQLLNGVGWLVPLALASQQFPLVRSVAPLSPALVLVLLTMWGGAWALPFYIPPGLVALRLGGRHHAALLTNIFGATGYFAGAIFTYFSMKWGKAGNWLPVLLLCAGGNFVSLITMNLAMKAEI
jgi:hypothetical protein